MSDTFDFLLLSKLPIAIAPSGVVTEIYVYLSLNNS